MVKNGDTVYLITYYNKLMCCREYYMNRSCFERFESAEREVELLKKAELKKQYKIRIRFKIESSIVKNAINKPII